MKDIAFPLMTNSLGNFDTAANYSQMWKQRVQSVLCTPRGSRVMRPEFGSQPQAAMFENYDDAETVVKGMVGSAFATWLPELQVQSITTIVNRDEASLVVDVWYVLPNGVVDTLTMSANASLYGFGVS